MVIQLLGTGAADGIPSLYSDSRVSSFARQHGGREIRRRASALIDGEIKIDYTPDIQGECSALGLQPLDWSLVIFTHSDPDHFAPLELQYALYPFTENLLMPFAIAANETIMRDLWRMYPEWPMELRVTRSFESFVHAGYSITPIRSNHLEDEDSHNLIFEKDGKRILYATDTGVYKPETWEFLQSLPMDILVLECTDGICSSGYCGHLDLKEFLSVIEKMHGQGTLTASSQIVTTHHSHHGDVTYEEYVKLLEPHGVIAGFDGITLDC
ncbi:MAG: hypothetical protein JSS72_06080 [Armatimonadetes bacterium]|nr:hypothetical protein [Armatimonadota bacterium]